MSVQGRSVLPPAPSESAVPVSPHADGDALASLSGRDGDGTTKFVRACELRMGDVLADTGAVVLGEGWPKAGRGGHVFSVFTNLGERIWPNDHRFNNIEIEQS